METNLEQQSPKLNVTNVSSAVFGKEEGATLGKESSIGKLSRILRTTRLKVNEVEKSITGISAKFLEIDKKITLNTENITGNIEKTETNAKKITSIKNTLQNQKSKIGEKLPGSTEEKEKAKLNTTLTETNRILVEIQKQLAYDFAMRAAEDKKEVAEDKEATSKERFKREESALEKSAKTMVSTVKTATKKVVSPIGNIFEKLLAFIGILGKGIAVNAAFEWFKDPENQKKITKFFNILKENWQLLAKILGSLALINLIGKIVGALATIKIVLTILTAKPVLIALAALSALKLGEMIGRPIFEAEVERQETIRETLKQEGYDEGKIRKFIEETPVLGVDGPLFQGQRNLANPTALPGDFDYRGGGLVPGLNLGGLVPGEGSSDTIHTLLTPGEFVIKKSVVQNYGQQYFQNVNNGVNIGGSTNNMRTEKIYQMLASGKKGRTRIVELPPQTIEGPKPEIKMPRGPATKAPKISSSNSLDGYRSVSSGIYGIMV